MPRVIIPYGKMGQPNTWSTTKHKNETVFLFTCPYGHLTTLFSHRIHSDGRVEPSMTCPDIECDFHQFIILDKWEEMKTCHIDEVREDRNG